MATPRKRYAAEKERAKRNLVIQQEYQEEGQYWIELRPGYQNGADPGTHAIVEDTKKLAYAKLDQVILCDCPDCLYSLQ